MITYLAVLRRLFLTFYGLFAFRYTIDLNNALLA